MRDTMPRVTVIIPTYNRASLIGEAIDSVLAQSARDIEVIVVDDGSTDGTSDVLDSYGDSIRVIRRPNGGQCAARNTGLERARGEFVAFLDSDDLLLPQKIELQLRGFERFPPVGMVCSRSVRFADGHGFDYREHDAGASEAAGEMQDIFEDMLLLKRAPLIHDTLVRRSCFDAAGNFDTRLRVAADHDIWLRVAALYPVALIDATVAAYRQHSSQVSNAGRLRGEYVTDLNHILDKLAGELPPGRQTPHVRALIVRARALVEVHAACCAVLSGGGGAALTCLRQALSNSNLHPGDAEQLTSIVVSYAVAADAAAGGCFRGIELLRAAWSCLPGRFSHLRSQLRAQLAFRYHDRGHLAAQRGERIAALADGLRWLRYRDPWRAPSFVARRHALRAGG